MKIPVHLRFLILSICVNVGLFQSVGMMAEASSSGSVKEREVATLGGGCFWCVEAVFQELDGVLSVTSGYSGGHKANPTYEEVCSGTTGHAEVVQVAFDPSKISFEEILDLFWDAHDPTTLNHQGADVGTQYRSVIFVASDEQKRIAEASKANAQKYFDDPIVTEIAPFGAFYVAEESHQDFFRNNPRVPYCVYVIQPKLKKLEEKLRKKTDDLSH